MNQRYFFEKNRVATSRVITCNYLCNHPFYRWYCTWLLSRFFSVFQLKRMNFFIFDVQDGTPSHCSGKGVFVNAELILDRVRERGFW